MGNCHTNKSVVAYHPEFSKYNKLLTSIRKKHAEFDFRILQIIYKRDNNILFKVDNMNNLTSYYLEQIQIKTYEDIEMILKKMQLSIEMTDGFLLKYYTSFASRNGNFVFIVYEFVELINLRELLSDQNIQEKSTHINEQVYSQIFSIFYLLNSQDLSIYNLALENVYVYQKYKKIYIKLIDITLIRKFEYIADSDCRLDEKNDSWRLEEYEKKSHINILIYLREKNIDNSQQYFEFLDKDLNDGKQKLSDVKDNYNAYKKHCQITKIQNIYMMDQDKANLNYFLFTLNKEIRFQVLQQYRSESQIEIILNDP